MDHFQLILGTVLMVLGVAIFVTAVFRALKHAWTFSVHELWLLPLTGITLILGGRWLIQ